MKLVGIRHRGHVWIAVQLDGAVSPIAEVDDFYCGSPSSSRSGAWPDAR